MKKLCESEQCTGCLACYSSCSQKAIVLQEQNGFFYPKIIEEKCISCGICSKVCPELYPVSKKKPIDDIAYAIFHKEKKIRNSSSSGGVFYSLAKSVIEKGGAVYGAAWTEKLLVKHIRIHEEKEISLLQGSKYVQSDMRTIYSSVSADLKQGIKVLFSGVPCQIAGLRRYLGKEYDNLYTCEVLCHGSTSPVVFEEHIKYIGRKYGADVTSVNFRYKTEERCQNITFGFQNGIEHTFRNPLEDWFYNGFQNGTLLRDSCYQCRYIGVDSRSADITLADFWGLEKNCMKFPDELTYPSLVFVNSDKGQSLFQENKEDWEIAKRPVKEAVWGNLSLRRPIPKNKWKKRFIENYQKYGYERAGEMCLISHLNWKERLKRILGEKVTVFLIKVLRR